MPNPTRTQRDRETLSSDRKAFIGQGREIPSKSRFAQSKNTTDVNIGRPAGWTELVESTQRALDNINRSITQLSSRVEKYRDQDGRLTFGGLAEGSVIGYNLAPAVVEELQRIGDAIGENGCLEDGTFASKTNEEWKKLHRV